MVRHSSQRAGFPAGSPIANFVVVIAGLLAIGISVVLGFFAIVALGISVVLGFFAIVALGSIILVAAALIGIRAWWFNYKRRRQSPADRQSQARRQPIRGVIEGEYRVVDKNRDET
jgi:membrane protein implicated in regulation of membrane protease activity